MSTTKMLPICFPKMPLLTCSCSYISYSSCLRLYADFSQIKMNSTSDFLMKSFNLSLCVLIVWITFLISNGLTYSIPIMLSTLMHHHLTLHIVTFFYTHLPTTFYVLSLFVVLWFACFVLR